MKELKKLRSLSGPNNLFLNCAADTWSDGDVKKGSLEAEYLKGDRVSHPWRFSHSAFHKLLTVTFLIIDVDVCLFSISSYSSQV